MTTQTEVKQGWTAEQEAAIARLMETGGVARRAAIRQMLKAERGEAAAPAPAPKVARKPKAVTAADRKVEVATPTFTLRQAAAEADRLLADGQLSPGLAQIVSVLNGWANRSLGYRDDQLKKSAKARKKGKV